MMYRVIKRFKDLQDDNYIYNAGDTYPREGMTPGKRRIKELESDKNRRGTPLIEEVAEDDADGDMPGDTKLV